MNYKIREIEKKDDKEIEHIIRECLIEFGANHQGTAWTDPDLCRFSQVYNSEGNKYWIAEDENQKILGGVGIGRLTGRENVCELQKMYCLPEARGKGVAHLLMQKALTYAGKYYESCYLETLDNMKGAQKFYEKYGFQRIDEPLVKTEHFACDVRYLKKMGKENKKDFNAMLHNSKDMPKIQTVADEKTIQKYGGTRMFFAPPIMYDELMKKVPDKKLITVGMLRDYLAKKNGADFTDPMTAGIFVNIAAWASYQRSEDITPYWRTLKSDGELNAKYPEGIQLQKSLLEAEGHIIVSKGVKNVKYYVKDFEKSLVDL